jgi:PTS system nitrogen regulatory IIA component
MLVAEFLSPDETFVEVGASSKLALLTKLASRAAAKVAIPADQIAAALIKREGLGTTGMGEGVAIPHARFQTVRKPFGLLVKLNKPVDFDAIDGRPVDVVFALLLPEKAEGGPVGVLATVARKLRSAAVLARVRNAQSRSELYDAIVGD